MYFIDGLVVIVALIDMSPFLWNPCIVVQPKPGLPSCKPARGTQILGNIPGRGERRWRTIDAVTFRTEPVS